MSSEEKTTRELHQYFLGCGLSPCDALEKLAFILAMEPSMFTRMVPILDELREENMSKQQCEECELWRISTTLRPNGRCLCATCNQLRLREMTPTGLVHRIIAPYLEPDKA